MEIDNSAHPNRRASPSNKLGESGDLIAPTPGGRFSKRSLAPPDRPARMHCFTPSAPIDARLTCLSGRAVGLAANAHSYHASTNTFSVQRTATRLTSASAGRNRAPCAPPNNTYRHNMIHP
jgi:hypothetical protein